MPTITCYHCFGQFQPSELYFRCPMHSRERFIFPYKPSSWLARFRTPRMAMCPRDWLITGYRVCPNPRCHVDLPYFAGRFPQRIVAVTGCGGTGKTVYLWSLLYQIMEVLSRDPHPFSMAMFEDDVSFQMYQNLSQRLLHEERVPDFTDVQEIRQQNRIPPLIVRVLTGKPPRSSFCNLVFFDPAGELFENFKDDCYLHYLARAAALIYLFDLPDMADQEQAYAQAARASDGLTAVVNAVRKQLGPAFPKGQRLPVQLALVITKSDETLFRVNQLENLVPGLQRGSAFWQEWRSGDQKDLEQTSGRLEEILRDHACDDLVNMARNNFTQVSMFAVSGLGHPPIEGALQKKPQPLGVENPLYWILKTLG